jgi:hypothetical protein
MSEFEVRPELADARKALRCLFIAVESSVAEDVQRRCEAAFTALDGDAREALRAVLHLYGPEGAQKVAEHVIASRNRRIAEPNPAIENQTLGKSVPNVES